MYRKGVKTKGNIGGEKGEKEEYTKKKKNKNNTHKENTKRS